MAEELLRDEVSRDDGAFALDAAVRRLDHALTSLEAKWAARAAAAETHPEDREGDLFESDRNRLAVELDAARARERALQDVAAEASAALGRAAAEVRAALSAEEG